MSGQMSSDVKGRLFGRKRTDHETKYLLISDTVPDHARVEESGEVNGCMQNYCHRERAGSAGSDFPNVTLTDVGADFFCDSRPRCYSHVLSLLRKEVRCYLPSPTLMRRRNAICDEIEKSTVDWPGKTLRQERVDMLRSIALTQFSLL